jgi:hypothetical protein
MKHRITAAFLANGLLALTMSLQAAETWHGSTLQFVYPLSNGDFVIGFDTSSSACTNPNSPKYMYVAVGQNGVDAEGAKKMYAAALTALVAGKTLSVAFDNATPSCYVNRFSVSK